MNSFRGGQPFDFIVASMLKSRDAMDGDRFERVRIEHWGNDDFIEECRQCWRAMSAKPEDLTGDWRRFRQPSEVKMQRHVYYSSLPSERCGDPMWNPSACRLVTPVIVLYGRCQRCKTVMWDIRKGEPVWNVQSTDRNQPGIPVRPEEAARHTILHEAAFPMP